MHQRIDRIIADGDHRHQVRTIPVAIEAAQWCGSGVCNDAGVADRQPLGVLGAAEEHREFLVTFARAGAESAAPFAENDAALGGDFVRFELVAHRPVLQDVERPRYQLRLVARHRQDVLRFIEAGVGVEVGAVSHADRFEVLLQIVLLEMRRAVEPHVLDEVRQAPLVVVLENRTGPHDQAKLEAMLGIPVMTNPVAQAVRQLTGVHGGVGWQRSGAGRLGRLLRGKRHGDEEREEGEAHDGSD